MNTKLYDSLLCIITSSSVDMENLYNYYKTKQFEKVDVIKEDEEEVPELLSDNESPVKKEVVNVDKDLTKKKSWGDYDTDDEDEFTSNLISSKEKENIKKEVEKKKNENKDKFYDNFAQVVKKGTKFENEDSKNSETFHEAKKQTAPSDDDVGFETVERKSKKKNPNLPVIRTGAEFQKMCNERKRPGIDYIIADDGHCDHTHNGTLCKNIRREPICYKIHMQRCTDGEYCERGERCTFIHVWDMNDEVARDNFNYTMREYNKIKADKKVRV